MIPFSKYHGCGNSFVILREEVLVHAKGAASDAPAKEAAYGAFAKALCAPHTGAGADGLIVVREKPALEMLFFNRDGSRAPMCGNGIRCFARYCREEGICLKDRYPVKTLAGELEVEVTCGQPFRARVCMGRPLFSPAAVGVADDGPDFLGRELSLKDGRSRRVDSLFLGTVHTVVFVKALEDVELEALGKELCHHPVFKEKTNVNFVEIKDPGTLRMRTYERGVGMTLACGTGACAAVVAANLRGLCKPRTEVELPLGTLSIEVAKDGNVYMEGPAVEVLTGTFCEPMI